MLQRKGFFSEESPAVEAALFGAVGELLLVAASLGDDAAAGVVA